MSYKLLYLARRAKGVSWDEWPRTWKSHAIFASQFPAMNGTIDWMRYTTRMDGPAVAGLPVSTDHDGVSVAKAPQLEVFYGNGFTPEQRQLIDGDELRVFDRYTPEFSFYCSETCVVDGPLGNAVLFQFLPRKGSIGLDEFSEYLQGEYLQHCRDSAVSSSACRWVMNLTVDTPPPDFPFEAIQEIWFDNPEDAVEAVLPVQKVTESLSAVCDVERSVSMLTKPTHSWPKNPEKV